MFVFFCTGDVLACSYQTTETSGFESPALVAYSRRWETGMTITVVEQRSLEGARAWNS